MSELKDIKLTNDNKNSTQQLLDALIVPAVTPNDPSDDNILENLEKLIMGNVSGANSVDGELNSVRLMIGMRRVVKSAERLINNGEERKAAVIYVCKMAVLHNVTDIMKRDTLLLLIDEVVPEVIEMVIDAAKNHKDYGVVADKVRNGAKCLPCL